MRLGLAPPGVLANACASYSLGRSLDKQQSTDRDAKHRTRRGHDPGQVESDIDRQIGR